MTLRIWPRSLIGRILFVELAAIVVVAVALPTLTIWLLHQQVDRYQIETLTEQAQEIGRGIDAGSQTLSVQLKPDLRQTYETPYDGRAYVIVDQAGRIRNRSAFAHFTAWPNGLLGHGRQTFRTGTVVGVASPVVVRGAPYWIVVTQDEAGRGAIIDDVSHAFLTRYAPILLGILLLLPLINSLLIRTLVTAVRGASDRARTIGPRTLDLRLDETGLPLEVTPLVHATNALLVRLEESFRQQSEFVANVAHELRTPLAALKVELDALDSSDLRHRLSDRVDRLGHVIAQLQALASLETAVLAFAPFDLAAMAGEAIAALVPQILDHGDTIALEGADAPIPIHANRTLIALALSNLISNATQHTPAGTAITVRVSAGGMIEVIDDGPGVAAANPQASKQRYWRADAKRSDNAGLGLSIVGRIMDVHDGELIVENRPGGGSRFALMLPIRLLANR